MRENPTQMCCLFHAFQMETIKKHRERNEEKAKSQAKHPRPRRRILVQLHYNNACLPKKQFIQDSHTSQLSSLWATPLLSLLQRCAKGLREYSGGYPRRILAWRGPHGWREVLGCAFQQAEQERNSEINARWLGWPLQSSKGNYNFSSFVQSGNFTVFFFAFLCKKRFSDQ